MAALRHRDFALFLVGRGPAGGLVNMGMVAVAYQIYDFTGDAMNLAYIGLAMFGPAIVFALFTGYVADTVDRRLIALVTMTIQIVAALLFYVVAAMGMPVVWPMYVIIVLLGSGRSFFNAAMNSYVPSLVPREDFANAMAWHQAAVKTAQVTGPALGGVLYLLGPEVVYLTMAGIMSVCLALLFMIRTRMPIRPRKAPDLETLLAGLHYILEKRIILGAITLDLFVVLMGGVTALIPIFARDILDVGPSGAGFMRSTFAIGGISAAIAMTHVTLTRHAGLVLFACVTIFGLCTIAFALSPYFFLTLVALAVMGAADVVSVCIRLTLLQILTPDDMVGRVIAVNSIFTGTSNEIGEFRAGVFAAWLGGVGAALVGGVGAILVAGVIWRIFPELARIQRLDRPV